MQDGENKEVKFEPDNITAEKPAETESKPDYETPQGRKAIREKALGEALRLVKEGHEELSQRLADKIEEYEKAQGSKKEAARKLDRALAEVLGDEYTAELFPAEMLEDTGPKSSTSFAELAGADLSIDTGDSTAALARGRVSGEYTAASPSDSRTAAAIEADAARAAVPDFVLPPNAPGSRATREGGVAMVEEGQLPGNEVVSPADRRVASGENESKPKS